MGGGATFGFGGPGSYTHFVCFGGRITQMVSTVFHRANQSGLSAVGSIYCKLYDIFLLSLCNILYPLSTGKVWGKKILSIGFLKFSIFMNSFKRGVGEEESKE